MQILMTVFLELSICKHTPHWQNLSFRCQTWITLSTFRAQLCGDASTMIQVVLPWCCSGPCGWNCETKWCHDVPPRLQACLSLMKQIVGQGWKPRLGCKGLIHTILTSRSRWWSPCRAPQHEKHNAISIYVYHIYSTQLVMHRNAYIQL